MLMAEEKWWMYIEIVLTADNLSPHSNTNTHVLCICVECITQL